MEFQTQSDANSCLKSNPIFSPHVFISSTLLLPLQHVTSSVCTPSGRLSKQSSSHGKSARNSVPFEFSQCATFQIHKYSTTNRCRARLGAVVSQKFNWIVSAVSFFSSPEMLTKRSETNPLHRNWPKEFLDLPEELAT